MNNYQLSDRIYACFGFLDDVKADLKKDYDFIRMPKKCPNCGSDLNDVGVRSVYFTFLPFRDECDGLHKFKCNKCNHIFTVRGPRGKGYVNNIPINEMNKRDGTYIQRGVLPFASGDRITGNGKILVGNYRDPVLKYKYTKVDR